MLPQDFGTGDWEVKGWIRPASFTKSYGSLISSSSNTWASGARFLMLYGDATGALARRIGLGGFDAVTGGVYQPAGNPLVTSSALVAGEWRYVRACKVSGICRLFLDEVLQGVASSSATWSFANVGFSIWDGVQGYFDGAMSGWSLKTVGISTDPEPVPPQPGGVRGYWSPLTSRSAAGSVAFSEGAAIYTAAGDFGLAVANETTFALRLPSGGDMHFGGPDLLEVVVKRRVGSSDLPQKARVSLLSARGRTLVRQRWSDALTGAAVFQGLDATRRYIAVAEYPGNPDNPAAEDYLRPVAGVSLKRGEPSS